MKKILNLFLLAAMILGMTSCSDDDKETLCSLTVQLESDANVSDFSKFIVTISEMRSGTEYTAQANASGKAVFASLPLGTYNIVAEDLVDGASTMYGHTESVVLAAESATETVKVSSLFNSMEKTFVLDELYFNGDKNGAWSYIYYESYMTIRNISDKPLYADGLSIAICGNYNSVEEENEMTDYLNKDTIVISQLYTIPGDGRTYRVEPGESLVLAQSAINHKTDESKTNSIDLSGADLEFYVPYEYAMTTDNPEVTNMIVDWSASQAFNWGYNGQTPIVLCRLSEAEREQIVNNRVELKMPMAYGNIMLEYLLLPKSKVVDGVETGTVDNLMRKVLPDAVDRSSILVNTAYGFDGQFIQRKRVVENGIEKVQDTNDSSNDFEVIEHGQKSYPKN